MLDHPHWWDIAAANGETSTGICRTCGEQKEFYNSINGDLEWKKVGKQTMKALQAIRKAAELEWRSRVTGLDC